MSVTPRFMRHKHRFSESIIAFVGFRFGDWRYTELITLKFMQLLHGSAVFEELRRQPVEQFGMRWLRSHPAESHAANSQSKVKIPNRVHNGPPRHMDHFHIARIAPPGRKVTRVTHPRLMWRPTGFSRPKLVLANSSFTTAQLF
jgi:hypothetical protein